MKKNAIILAAIIMVLISTVLVWGFTGGFKGGISNSEPSSTFEPNNKNVIITKQLVESPEEKTQTTEGAEPVERVAEGINTEYTAKSQNDTQNTVQSTQQEGTQTTGIQVTEELNVETEIFNYNNLLSNEFTIIPEGKYKFKIKNTLDKDVNIEILITGSKYKLTSDSLSMKVEKAQEAELEIKADKTADKMILSCKITVNEASEYLAASNEALLNFISKENIRDANVCLINDMEFEELNISYPFLLNLSGHKLKVKNDFYMKDNKAGNMIIKNQAKSEDKDENLLEAGNIFIDAPQWMLSMDVQPEQLKGESASYYTNVKSINDVEIDNANIVISSGKQLEDLCNINKNPVLRQDINLHFKGEYSLKGNYKLALPVSLYFDENVDVEDAVIVIDTIEKGGINVSAKCDYAGYFILFDAPLCDIVWEEGKPSDAADFINQMNIASYNGQKTDESLGGLGREKITGVRISKESNKELTEDITFTVTGNIIAGYYGLTVSGKTISKMKPDITITGGKVEFQKAHINADGTINLTKDARCTVTDANGNTRTYLVRTIRKQYNLPIMNITTQKSKGVDSILRDEYMDATFSIRANVGSKFPSVSNTDVTIKGRGNSTWKWEKKPFRLKFENKIEILGMTAAKNWILLANYADKSLIRNRIASAIGNELTNMTYIAQCELVDLYIDGEYQGIYLLSERIEGKKGRVELKERSTVDTGYLLEVGGTDTGDVLGVDYFHTSTLRHVYIRTPDEEIRTKEHVEFIKDYVTKAEEAVKNLTNYEDYIDIPSLIDWFILHELSYNLDSSFRRSCYLTKEPGGKLKMGPPWDFDLAFGNFSTDNQKYDTWASVGREKKPEEEKNPYVRTTWFNYLLEDPNFTKQLKARWNEINDKIVKTALKEIDECYKVINQSQEENFKVWKILGVKAAFESKKTAALKTYDEQIEYLKNFIKTRQAWMDKTIKELK